MVWNLKDLETVKPNGLRVLSTFSGCGGSSMGYKLAGYEVVGGVEIDPRMAANYEHNLKTKVWCMPIKEFTDKLTSKKLSMKVDVLDGSPPCSSFSMAGARQRHWGKEKRFTEGQAKQVLDNLFFEFIELAQRLQPSVVVAENVGGLIVGKAKYYAKEIIRCFRDIGYTVQLFQLRSERMGVPQARLRLFFIANKLNRKLALSFNEKPITAAEATADLGLQTGRALTPNTVAFKLWHKARPGQCFDKVHPKKQMFNYQKVSPKKPFPTIPAHGGVICHWEEPRNLSRMENIRAQTFPDDYEFVFGVAPAYGCGMSVPPIMMMRIAQQVEKAFFAKQ